MGLIISKIEKNGNKFLNAYAKVHKYSGDNTSKHINFSIAIYAAKGDKSPITIIDNKLAKSLDGNIIPSCYATITENVAYLKASLDAKIAAIVDIVDGDPVKLALEKSIDALMDDPMFLFDGAISDEVENPETPAE